MNFKERGITVGDLLLLFIFISIVSFATLKLKDDNNRKSYANFYPLTPSIFLNW